MSAILFLDSNALIALVVAFAPLCSEAAEPLSGMEADGEAHGACSEPRALCFLGALCKAIAMGDCGRFVDDVRR